MGSIFDIINIPMGYVIKFFYTLTNNYFITLLLFAIIAKALLFPFGIKQQKNSVQMAKMRPKEAVIRKKYAGRNDKATQAKLNEEIMALYKEENYNAFGGCLPLLIQLPIIMALYNIVRNPLTYISGLAKPLIDQLTAKGLELINAGITDAAKMTKILDQTVLTKMLSERWQDFSSIFADAGVDKFEPINMTMFGGAIDLTARPTLDFDHGFPWLLLIPILNFVVSFVSMKVTRKFTYQPTNPAGGDNAQAQMSNKLMDITMPLLSLWIAFQMSSAIGVYWIIQSLLGMAQAYILFRMYPIPKLTDADYAEAEAKYGGKKKKKKQTEVIEGEYSELEDEIDSEENTLEDAPAEIGPSGKLSELPKGINPAAKAKYSKTGKKYNVKKK